MENILMTDSLGEKSATRSDVPLVIDMDGTLLKVDSLHEAFIQFLSRHPFQALRALFVLPRGPAAFKAIVADHVLPDVSGLPLDPTVVGIVKEAKSGDREVYLATAADRRFAECIANSMGCFDGVFASENGVNLKGQLKADRLVSSFGLNGFDYIGNSWIDRPVWRAARTALIVGADKSRIQRLRREFPNLVSLRAANPGMSAYLTSLRPHQWLKNLLVGLPALAAHHFTLDTFVTVLIAFLSFSFAASSAYVANDIIDAPHDRAHPEKRHRPLAAGALSLSRAAALLLLAAGVSSLLATMLPWMFGAILLAYFALSLSYSLYLKRKIMVDVVALAALYGIRVLAGGAATGIALSHWLLGFCFFLFLSLALMKRGTELISLGESAPDSIKGRGYRRSDLPIVNALTASSGFVGVLVLALYISSPEVAMFYRRPELLWGVGIVLVYWLGRAFILTGRGEMRQDPVVFAITDRTSLLAGSLAALLFVAAL
jgi:4-hydroxybenzoate polyprenyltransferase